MSNVRTVKDAEGTVVGSVEKVTRKVRGEEVTRYQAIALNGAKLTPVFEKQIQAVSAIRLLASGVDADEVGVKIGRAPKAKAAPVAKKAAPKAKAKAAPVAKKQVVRDEDFYVRIALRHAELKSYRLVRLEEGLVSVRSVVKKGNAILAQREAEAKAAARKAKAAERRAAKKAASKEA